MSECILDASALLALINQEKGKELVEKLLPVSVMSSVNVAEVVGEICLKLNIDSKDCESMVSTLVNKIVDFDLNQAVLAGELKRTTSKYGLSLGDRACVGLGLSMNLPIYTSDTIWSKLDMKCKIILIR